MHVKRSYILTDRFGPEVFSSFEIKGKLSYARIWKLLVDWDILIRF